MVSYGMVHVRKWWFSEVSPASRVSFAWLNRLIMKKFHQNNYLVGGFNPFWKILVKWEFFPNFRGEHKKYLWNHHLDYDRYIISSNKNMYICGSLPGINGVIAPFPLIILKAPPSGPLTTQNLFPSWHGNQTFDGEIQLKTNKKLDPLERGWSNPHSPQDLMSFVARVSMALTVVHGL